MKHLLKLLSPFAPDQSGVVSVLYELGGLVVICDAGGCTGNICGFDEPRWFETKSAVFSAGLRDMDAILGRDDLLIKKTADAVKGTELKFTAIVGTPVPAVIATDYKALKRMAENQTGLPSLTIDTTGTNLYDMGEEKTFLSLFETFAVEQYPVIKGKIGIIGATPLEISSTRPDVLLQAVSGAVCYGMGAGIDEIKRASEAEENLVISPAGIKSAEYLKKKFGTPYRVEFPYIPECLDGKLDGLNGKKILIIHQQLAANAVRNVLLKQGVSEITVGSWFMLDEKYKESNDVHFTDEDQMEKFVENGRFDVIIADKLLERPLRKFDGDFIDFPHFAVSGRINECGGEKCRL